MKIKLVQNNNKNWHHFANEVYYIQKQYDYIVKHLDFDKLYKKSYMFFYYEGIKEWFYKTYINTDWLDDIYNDSPEGYQWLKQNWGKGIFKMHVYYLDKQEFKTIVNKIINVQLIRNNK